MGQQVGKPRASILTFWTKKRMENNLTLADLSELVGINYSTLGKELTGEQMPPLAHISKLCELFNVALDEGEKQSKKAHTAWVGAHNLAKESSEENEPEPVTETSDNILRIVYGNISYDDFMLIQDKGTDSKETLEILYNKVDYDTFMKLLNDSLGGGN